MRPTRWEVDPDLVPFWILKPWIMGYNMGAVTSWNSKPYNEQTGSKAQCIPSSNPGWSGVLRFGLFGIESKMFAEATPLCATNLLCQLGEWGGKRPRNPRETFWREKLGSLKGVSITPARQSDGGKRLPSRFMECDLQRLELLCSLAGPSHTRPHQCPLLI